MQNAKWKMQNEGICSANDFALFCTYGQKVPPLWEKLNLWTKRSVAVGKAELMDKKIRRCGKRFWLR